MQADIEATSLQASIDYSTTQANQLNNSILVVKFIVLYYDM